MIINRIINIYYSATLTTEKVVTEISKEISEKLLENDKEIPNYNFAYPKNREGFPKLSASDLVIFALPTYAGRLPNLMLKYLETIEGCGALAVPVVTYGNRNFDNSLIELRNILETHNFHTVAAGAFSCEHSFSYELGKGRPDEQDILEIKDFALKISEKVQALCEIPAPIEVPGDPAAGYYKPQDKDHNFIDIRKAKPKTTDACSKCGLCIEICPMGAINPKDPADIVGVCTKCCACFKRCPMQAKYFDDEGYLYHKKSLEEMYGDKRASNMIFI